MMRFAVDVTGFGTYAEAEVVAEVAVAAESAGWDGVFVWDHLGWAIGIPCGDPWVSLTTAAVATERIRLGIGVCPLPRRRPQVVATAGAALDRLSGGRFVFGAGLGGVEREFEAFGESADARARASLLDDGLDLIDRLWRGDDVDRVRLAPGPVQRPRPPIWIGGSSPGALRRAARWDGYHAGSTVDEYGDRVLEPDELARRLAVIERDGPFDVAVAGSSEPGDVGVRARYGAVGTTWWLETIHDHLGSLDAMLDRVRAGP